MRPVRQKWQNDDGWKVWRVLRYADRDAFFEKQFKKSFGINEYKVFFEKKRQFKYLTRHFCEQLCHGGLNHCVCASKLSEMANRSDIAVVSAPPARVTSYLDLYDCRTTTTINPRSR